MKAALQSSASEIKCLYVQKGRRDSRLRDLQNLARKHAISCEEVSRASLNALIREFPHQGVIAELHPGTEGVRRNLIEFLKRGDKPSDDRPYLILLLDAVQDPHNLGACLRSAEAAGVHAVVVPADNSVGLTAVVRKVACGAAESVPFFQVTNLQRTIVDLQAEGVWVYGADGDASDTLYALDLTGPVALVMGAEGAGLRRLTGERCDALYRIPMTGQVSSLNVSVAAGISLFEAVRQRTA